MGVESATAMSGESPLRRHLAWLLVSLAYLYVFPYYERLNNPNENVRTWATRAVVEHGVLNIDEVQREWGYVNDKAIAGKRLYSSKAPGASFLGVPVLFVHTKLRHMAGWPSPGKRATTFWLRLCAVQLPLCLFLWFFARFIERVTRSPVARDLLVVALGAGTLFYPYGVIFVGHSLSAALAFAGYMILSHETQSPAAVIAGRPRAWLCKSLAWAGALTALSVVFEYQALLLAAVLAVYALVRYRVRATSFILGAAPPAIALGVYHTVLFGKPWKFPYAAIENPEFLRTGHSEGFHGLALPKLGALRDSLFASDYGLFVFSPVLFLGALCAVYAVMRRPRREGLVIVASCLVMFLFLSGMSNWRAGWCVGPRYITTVAPFLVAAIAHVWPQLQPRSQFRLSLATAGLLIPSVALNVVSGAVYPHYPVQFNNPVFDLTFPLLGDGFVPYSLGQVLHLPGAWSLVPLAVVVVVAVSLGVSGSDPQRWAQHSGLAVLIAALFLLPLSRYGRRPDPGEAHATALVRSLWEPPPVPRAEK